VTYFLLHIEDTGMVVVVANIQICGAMTLSVDVRLDNGELNRDELQDFLDTFTMVEEVPQAVSPLSMEIVDQF
jgi:hypothetical protein